MICQISQRIKSLSEDFWETSLEDLYQRMKNAVRSRKVRFLTPSRGCARMSKDYVLNGGYTRNRIIDIQRVQDCDGNWYYKKIIIEKFRVQRIWDRKGNCTHAILPELFVPFRQYSLRFIIYHLAQFFSQSKSQEVYCLDAGIGIKTFKKWLKWIKDHIVVLAELGLTKNGQDNRKIMQQWIQELNADILGWVAKSLRRLNLGLFQEHLMPANTSYQNYEKSG